MAINLTGNAQTLQTVVYEPPKGIHVKEKGAMGDGRFLYDGVTNLSNAVITSASGFPGATIGMVVFVRKGGASEVSLWTTITAVGALNGQGVPGSITVADQPSTVLTDAYIVYGTDDTQAWRDCMRECIDNDFARAGRCKPMYVDPVIYMIAGDVVTDDGYGVNPNVVLPVWPVSSFVYGYTRARRHLSIICDQPHHSQQCWLLIDTPPALHEGCWLVCKGIGTAPGGGIPAAAVFGTSLNGNQSELSLTNIGIAIDPNPDGRGVVLSGVRGNEFATVRYMGTIVCVNTSIMQMVEPTATYKGVIVGLSSVDAMRDVMSVFRDTQVWGMPVGNRLTEHVVVDGNHMCGGCLIGADAADSGQLWVALRLSFHWNRIHFNVSAPTGTQFHIVAMNFEEKTAPDYNGHTWLETIYHISDENNIAQGTIECARISYSTAHGGVAIHGASGNPPTHPGLVVKDHFSQIITARV